MTLIKIPLRLVSEANTNEPWQRKAKRHKIQKLIVKSYLEKEMPIPLPCKIILKRFSPRPFDSDNLQSSFKYIRDQIAESVTGCDIPGRADSDPRISWNYCQEKTKNKEYYITVEILADRPCTPNLT